MARRRSIPDELGPELVRLYEAERYTLDALVDWLKAEHDLLVAADTVRCAIWRTKGEVETTRPDSQEPVIEHEPTEPADALQVIRYQLARDAHGARCRMIRNPADEFAGRFYLGLQTLRVNLLKALRQTTGAGKGAVPEPPKADPVQTGPRFLVAGKPVDLPS